MTGPTTGAAHPDPVLGLREGDASFARTFARLFSAEPEFLGEAVPVRTEDGDTEIAIARYDHNGIASVTTLGLERVRLPGDARIELLCEVVEPHAAAAEVAVRIALERVLGRLRGEAGPIMPGEVWLNAMPFLSGTRIQGLVAVDASWSGRDQTVRDDDGNEVGMVNEVVMLTKEEAKRVAHDGLVPLLEASNARPAARLDVLRDDLVDPPEPLPRVACWITRAAVEHGVRWLQRDAEGGFLAIHLTETAEELADPATYESAPLASVVAGVPDLRGFAVRAEPGTYAMLEGDAWVFGDLAPSEPDRGDRPAEPKEPS